MEPKKEKRKMQNVRFANVNEFLDFLPEEELRIVEYLRELVLECIPDCTEKLSYNVPFYKRHTTICFIWPGSVTWGNVKQSGVRFGLSSGHLIHDETGYFDQGDRKYVSYKDFFSIREIDRELLSGFLYEAVIVDDEKAKAKRRR